ncbi:MAG: hypothetical protein SFX72_01385 [Isosphaeraceae bacterium]|nr:hypothetical protein [Isosphaeraceae bacterium]
MRRRGNGIVGVWIPSIVTTFVVMIAAQASAADRVQSVPLGGKLGEQRGDKEFGVYVPTRFGGVLTVKTTAGKVEKLTGPDGKERKNGQEVGNDQHGWYTFKVAGAEKDKSYEVETTFVQVGESVRRPWNFYYWPTKSDAIHEPWAGGNARVDTPRPYGDDILVATPGSYIAPGQDIVRAGPNGILETPVSPGDDSTWFPNLYDDVTWRGADGTLYATPSPMLKYDQLFNSAARSWEAANSQNQDISRWPGHCLGGAVASILLNEPVPAPGTGMTQDELKALWAELGENHYNHRIGDYANEIPAGPPRPGLDVTDRFVPRFHQVLETHVRGRRIALLGNLRAFPPRGTPNEVWNHGIGKYTATYHAVPGKGERSIRLEIVIEANSGSNLNNDDNKPRMVNYEYTLVYGLDGRVDETAAEGADWISVGGEAQYCPLNLLEVLGTTWQGHNPYVNEANVRALDLANGGGQRFAGAPRQFSPVGTYEAGRPPAFARGNGNQGLTNATPRRGLLRGLFGGR